MAGTVVRLYYRDEDGLEVLAAETIADAAGRYRFDAVTPCSYFIEVSSPEGEDLEGTGREERSA